MSKKCFKNDFLIRDFCIQQFPFIAEDFDALTTYELLSKAICYLKEIGKYTEEMGKAFEQLKEYVDGYFDDEKIPDVIADIINQMYEDGKITEAIDELVAGTSEKFKRLVYVNDYGAKGDGVTDDTEAIQRAIDENPYAIFIFHGRYKITDTITIKFGSQTFLLTEILYAGEKGGVAFHLTSDYYGEEPEGLPLAKGGTTFIGGSVTSMSGDDAWQDWELGTAFWNDTFGTRFDSVTVRKYRDYGILNAHTLTDWSNGDNKSTQLNICNCRFENYPEMVGTALAMVHTDNRIVNCNANGCKIGIGYYGGNLYVSNTHLTPTVGLTYPNDCYWVEMRPLQLAGVMNLSMEHCYFNGVPRVAFHVPNPISHGLILNNNSFIYGTIHDTNTTFDIIGGNQTFVRRMGSGNVVRASIESNVRCIDLRDRSSISMIDTQNPFYFIPERNATTVNHPLDVRNEIITPKRIIVANSAHAIPAQSMRRIARMVKRFDTCPYVKFELTRQSSLLAELYVSYNDYFVKYLKGVTSLKFYIDAEQKSEVINGNTIYYKDIYIANPTEQTSTDTWSYGCQNTAFPFADVYGYIFDETEYDLPGESDYIEIPVVN